MIIFINNVLLNNSTFYIPNYFYQPIAIFSVLSVSYISLVWSSRENAKVAGINSIFILANSAPIVSFCIYNLVIIFFDGVAESDISKSLVYLIFVESGLGVIPVMLFSFYSLVAVLLLGRSAFNIASQRESSNENATASLFILTVNFLYTQKWSDYGFTTRSFSMFLVDFLQVILVVICCSAAIVGVFSVANKRLKNFDLNNPSNNKVAEKSNFADMLYLLLYPALTILFILYIYVFVGYLGAAISEIYIRIYMPYIIGVILLGVLILSCFSFIRDFAEFFIEIIYSLNKHLSLLMHELTGVIRREVSIINLTNVRKFFYSNHFLLLKKIIFAKILTLRDSFVDLYIRYLSYAIITFLVIYYPDYHKSNIDDARILQPSIDVPRPSIDMHTVFENHDLHLAENTYLADSAATITVDYEDADFQCGGPISWKYGSVNELGVPLMQCNIPNEMSSNTIILAIALSSKGADLQRENSRSLQRSAGIGKWFHEIGQKEEFEAYVLNLGMNLRKRKYVSKYLKYITNERQLILIKISVQWERGSISDHRNIGVWVHRFVKRHLDYWNYALCDLYNVDGKGKLLKVKGFDCEATTQNAAEFSIK